MTTFSAAILAGGKSRRMGTDKSFTLLHGRPIFEHVLTHVRQLEIPTFLITNAPGKYAAYSLTTYADILPDQGSLGGLYTAIRSSKTDFTLCVACDMPFLNVKLLQHLLDLCTADLDVVVPQVGGYPEAMHAIYSKACLEPIHKQITQGNLKASGFYEQVKVRFVEEEILRQFDLGLRSFVNVNTPDDLLAADTLNPS